MPKSRTGKVTPEMVMRINLNEVKDAILEYKKSGKKFFNDFEKEAAGAIAALRVKAEGYAPIEFGVLDKTLLKLKRIKTISANSIFATIDFIPDYAPILETKPWGLQIGNPYRPRTAQKAARLGTPIGPRYAARAANDFDKELKKGKFGFRVKDAGKLRIELFRKGDVV